MNLINHRNTKDPSFKFPLVGGFNIEAIFHAENDFDLAVKLTGRLTPPWRDKRMLRGCIFNSPASTLLWEMKGKTHVMVSQKRGPQKMFGLFL